MKGVAILIANINNINKRLFSNGLNQNIFNLYDVISKIEGFKPYICTLSNKDDFDKNLPELKKMGYDGFNYSIENIESKNIEVVLEAGTFSNVLFKLSKKRFPHIKHVTVEYGNPYFFYSENIIFKKEKEFPTPRDRDAVWYSPHFEFCREFIKSYSNCNEVHQCPFVWSDKFIKNDLKTFNKTLKDFQKDSYSRVGILESNVNIVKTSVIPMLICNELYKENSQIIKNVNTMSSKKLLESETFNVIRKGLDLDKDKKIQYYDRYPIVEIFSKISDCLVTHQHYNELNYIYMDAIFLGIPIVHNSNAIKEVGYHYNDFNLPEGKERLKEAILTHKFRSEDIKKKEKKFLREYSVDNKKNIDGYKLLLEKLF